MIDPKDIQTRHAMAAGATQEVQDVIGRRQYRARRVHGLHQLKISATGEAVYQLEDALVQLGVAYRKSLSVPAGLPPEASEFFEKSGLDAADLPHHRDMPATVTGAYMLTVEGEKSLQTLARMGMNFSGCSAYTERQLA